MKTVIAIWAIVVIVGVGLFIYIDGVIAANAAPEPTGPTLDVREARPTDPFPTRTFNPQETINGKELQG